MRADAAEYARNDHALDDLVAEIAGCTDLEQLRGLLASALPALLPVSDRISIVFREPDGEWLRIHRILPRPDAISSTLPRVKIEGTPVGRVVSSGVGCVVADTRTDPNITFGHASHDGIRSTVSVPVRYHNRVIGAMNAGSRIPGACNEAMLEQLDRVASMVVPAFYAAERGFLGRVDGLLSRRLPTLEENERSYIEHVLELRRGVIEGEHGAARILGVPPSTLRSKMKKLGIAAVRAKGAAS